MNDIKTSDEVTRDFRTYKATGAGAGGANGDGAGAAAGGAS